MSENKLTKQAVHRQCVNFFSLWTTVEALYDENTPQGKDFAEEFVRDVASHLFSNFLPIAHDMVTVVGHDKFQIPESDMLRLASSQTEHSWELHCDPNGWFKSGRRMIAWSAALHPSNGQNSGLGPAAQYRNGLFRHARELAYDEDDNFPYNLRWRLLNQPLIFAFRVFEQLANLNSFSWDDTPFWQHHGPAKLRHKKNHEWTLDFCDGERDADAPTLEQVEIRYREAMKELQIGPDREWLPSLKLGDGDMWWQARLERHQGRAAAELPEDTVSTEAEGGGRNQKAHTWDKALDAFYEWWGDRTGDKQWQDFIDWSKGQPATDKKFKTLWQEIGRPTSAKLRTNNRAYLERKNREAIRQV